ncbi:glycosyltransferase family 2 protein [Ilyomonas limi]|uniref:Glycosyltransferase family 2 protein n=1 Tax=Ilyomonas limi TaxID=2575867 RepID=A0A4U3L3B0_9BACT|nr:glycosyltransferase family 2 protein [Ilyomonas limi]TKK68027.1 glycosyltransferase family 2 protein [Ilyomonas limi]
MNESVTILLATYNGEKYLSRQIESLLHQTYSNWRLLIRDDHSTDKTPVIIQQYCTAYPDKIFVVENNRSNSGSVLNFSALLSAATDAAYIMFCDQDDEWMNNKIAITLHKMLELEKQYGSNFPVMVFTDFLYADENLNVIESKKKFTVNRIKDIAFPQMLVQNPAYGCTAMINRTLAGKVAVIPPQAENHDYWIALVAAAFGKLYYLPQKTILYRQHTSNVSGNYDNSSLNKRVQRIIVNKKNLSILTQKKHMLLQFKKQYYPQLSTNFKMTLDDFMALYNNTSLPLLWKNLRNGIRSQTMLQTLLLYGSFFFYKNKDAH